MADHRLRRNAIRINKGLKKYGRLVGQDILWYEFRPNSVEDVDSSDPGTDFDDDLYDEGGSQLGGGKNAQWYSPVVVRVIQAVLDEGSQTFMPEGLYTVDSLFLVVSYEVLRRAGLYDPTDRGGSHLSDRVGYDGRVFTVNSFNPRGRISNVPGFTVSVHCLELKDDEIATDDLTWEFGVRKTP